ncbi:MAG: ABC transporter substrate-binding protein, partial [Citrobacter freundii]|nr:ABC transporter substrate-binding protein [Citrobacter freundii]
RRMFAQLVASALLLRHLPALAQTPLTVAVGGSPGPNITLRVVSAGAPADMLLLAVAPEKVVGFSSFDFSRQTAIPFHDDIRTLPKLGRLAGRANADETWLSQARQVSAQTHIPWLLINGELRHTPEQLRAAGEALGVVSRTAMQAALARRFIDNAIAFSHTAAANLRFYAARGARGLETGLQGSLHTEAAELLGLQNVAHIPGRQGLTQVSMENLLSWQPDIILVQDTMTAQHLREDPIWQGVKAVADRRILFLSGLPFGWLDAPPGINRLLGLRRLHAWLEPQVNKSFKADMQRYSELFWHTTLSDAQYQRLVAV